MIKTKKLTRNQIIELVDLAMNACVVEPKGDPDRGHRYVIACCAKILEAEGCSIDRYTRSLLKVETPVGIVNFRKIVEEDLKENF